jgi:hypothetical protein
MSKLQETRRKSITELVEKYKKLVDNTYEAVSKPLPDFEEIRNKEDEIIATSEMQLFQFIDIRNKALDNANQILFKINTLEIELNNPEILDEKKEEEDETAGDKKTNWTKKKAAESK